LADIKASRNNFEVSIGHMTILRTISYRSNFIITNSIIIVRNQNKILLIPNTDTVPLLPPP